MCKTITVAVREGVTPSNIVRIISSFGVPGHVSMKSVKDKGFVKILTLSDTSGSVLPDLEKLFYAISPLNGDSQIVIEAKEKNVEVLLRILNYIKGEEVKLKIQEIRNEKGIFLAIIGTKDFIGKVLNRRIFEFPISEQDVGIFFRDIKLFQPMGVGIKEIKKDNINYLVVEGLIFTIACGVMAL